MIDTWIDTQARFRPREREAVRRNHLQMAVARELGPFCSPTRTWAYGAERMTVDELAGSAVALDRFVELLRQHGFVR